MKRITLLTALLFVSVSSFQAAVADDKPVRFGVTVDPMCPLNTLKPSFMAGPSVEYRLPEKMQVLPGIKMLVGGVLMAGGHTPDSILANHEAGPWAANAKLRIGFKFDTDSNWAPTITLDPRLTLGFGTPLGGRSRLNYSLANLAFTWEVLKKVTVGLSVGWVPTSVSPAAGAPAAGGQTNQEGTVENPAPTEGTVENPAPPEETVENPATAEGTVENPATAEGTVENPAPAQGQTGQPADAAGTTATTQNSFWNGLNVRLGFTWRF